MAATPFSRIIVRLLPEGRSKDDCCGDDQDAGPGRASLLCAAHLERCTARSAGAEQPCFLTVSFNPGQTLAQAVYMSGLFLPPALCSGLAVCGRCRMRLSAGPQAGKAPAPAPADRHFFTEEELSHGWRLSCRHVPTAGMLAELPEDTILSRPHPAPLAREKAPPSVRSGLALAVDLGTTSLQWQLLDAAPPAHAADLATSGPRVFWQGSRVNPQMGAGSDVMSRLAVAQQQYGRERLRQLTLDALRDVVREGRERARMQGEKDDIAALCLAANQAMTCIALGKDTQSLAAAPYALPYRGGQWEKEPGLPPLWVAPQLSPFVGGDIAAGYASLVFNPDFTAPAFPFLLADMGTNGEFLLALAPDKALCASVALGPALEGTGLSCGSDARSGAVADFTLGPGGLIPWALPEQGEEALPAFAGAQLRGITGTGYIALLHLLLQSGALDRDGHFTPDRCGAFRRFFTPQPGKKGEGPSLSLPSGLKLSASDIEEVLKVKAAFSLGLHRLLRHAGVASHALRGIFLAGALGRHVRLQALEDLGFFPQGMAKRLTAVGNASLSGASLLAREENARSSVSQWAKKVSGIELASDSSFARDYAGHMRFAW